MSALYAQIRRLFQPVSRVLLLDFHRPADWPHIAGLLDHLRDDLELPLPALSAEGKAGFRLWFSLAEEVPQAEGLALLQAVCTAYLTDLPPGRYRIAPAAPDLAFPPVRIGKAEQWTTFIDPAMGAMFKDEPWLEIEPGAVAQAEMLLGLRPMRAEDVRRARESLSPAPVAEADTPSLASPGAISGPVSEPVAYLLSVMNDAAADPALRVEAAKALLPYFARPLAPLNGRG